jgi:hypothetical protein
MFQISSSFSLRRLRLCGKKSGGYLYKEGIRLEGRDKPHIRPRKPKTRNS